MKVQIAPRLSQALEEYFLPFQSISKFSIAGLSQRFFEHLGISRVLSLQEWFSAQELDNSNTVHYVSVYAVPKVLPQLTEEVMYDSSIGICKY